MKVWAEYASCIDFLGLEKGGFPFIPFLPKGFEEGSGAELQHRSVSAGISIGVYLCINGQVIFLLYPSDLFGAVAVVAFDLSGEFFGDGFQPGGDQSCVHVIGPSPDPVAG